jgi:hypothetical protein
MTRDFARRIAAAARHPEFTRAQTLVPEEPLAPTVALTILAFAGIGFACLAVVLLPGAVTVWLLALIVALTMVVLVRSQWLALARRRRAPIRRALAAVLGKGSDGMPTRLAWNAVLLWSPNGGLQRLEARLGVHRACTPGDIGVALYRGRHLVGWVRVPS